MHLHEYQAKTLLNRVGIASPPFTLASNEKELEEAIRHLQEKGCQNGVIKAQIHAGARGKGGGILFARNPQEALQFGKQLLGTRLITPQTGPRGLRVSKLMLTVPVTIQKQYYLAALFDSIEGQAFLIASSEGGMEIEELSRKAPEHLLKIPFPAKGAPRRYQLWELAHFMGWRGVQREQGMAIAHGLAEALTSLEALLIEINPLAWTKEETFLALDAKISLDENALYRHPELASLYDPSQSTLQEVRAREWGLSYVELEGEIGCLVNGAGLAMATMDLIHEYGGRAANFLDVGGSATREAIAHGVALLAANPQVKALFVNIFGGIMDCKTLAQGILKAAETLPDLPPLIIRLEGTESGAGRELLQNSGLALNSYATLAEAARAAIEAARRTGGHSH